MWSVTFLLVQCAISRDALNLNGFEVRNQITWVKKVATYSFAQYKWKHEPIFCAMEKAARCHSAGIGRTLPSGEHELTDTELLKALKGMVERNEEGESTVWRLAREQKYDHPTQKPLKLVSIAIRNSSKRDEIVLDLFGGRGSTLIVPEQLNGRCYIMELDPRFVDVIVKRFEKLTGETVVKL